MVRTAHVAGKTTSSKGGQATAGAGKKKAAAPAAAAAGAKGAKGAGGKGKGKAKAAVAADAGAGVQKKRKLKRSSVFALSPFKAWLHERSDAIWRSGLFADQLSDNAVGKPWVSGDILEKKLAKNSVQRILFAGDVPNMIRSVVERVLLARMTAANRVALNRRRRLDGSLARRNVHVTGADLRVAKEMCPSAFMA